METKQTGTGTAAAGKGILENLKASAKITDAICKLLNNKLVTSKSASKPDITEVGGVNKAEMMKLIEILDSMGSMTYTTACALRDLYNRMK